MNFALDDDVVPLVDSIADFFERRGDAEAIAGAAGRSQAFDRRRWTALCGLGLPVLRLPEPDGIGAGLLEATAVAETFGAVLLPEPATATIVLAAAWSAHQDGAAFVRELAAGSRVTVLTGFDTAVLSAAGEVSGRITIPDGTPIDAVAVPARDDYTGEAAIVVLDIATLPQPLSRNEIDPTRPSAAVVLERVEPRDVLRLTDSDCERVRCEFTLLTLAELVGGMQKVLTQTVEYVKAREQFGRPIGSFQAVKHRLADFYAVTEQARAAVQFAALECVQESGAASASVASVARWLPRSAIGVLEDAIHLHGGMGYSWELDVHLHLRRALSVRSALQDSGTAVLPNFSAAL
ncbi:acyl-CoA/acyl-ACP dehydrogenase [Mycobacterium sp. NBC_00419]|uniref:acyl-CoA dehydrogenase family protein n=1 Tax=Mycobacterium sp. NBC_00419 TaxID=2975989 RepID=UPI002E22FB30